MKIVRLCRLFYMVADLIIYNDLHVLKSKPNEINLTSILNKCTESSKKAYSTF
jgi:hypothetical protein